MNYIKINQEDYNSLARKDDNTYYWINGTINIYKGANKINPAYEWGQYEPPMDWIVYRNGTESKVLASRLTVAENEFSGKTSIVTISFPKCTSVGTQGFISCTSLTTVNLPNCSRFGNFGIFEGCTSLSSVVLSPYIGQLNAARAFQSCALSCVDFLPNCNELAYNPFQDCSNLVWADLPMVTYMDGQGTFQNCTSLTHVTFKTFSMYELNYSSIFSGCTNLQSIYVQSAYIDTFKSLRNWSYYSNKMVPINNDSLAIYPYEFYYNNAIQEIPASKCNVSAIGNYGLYHCNSLTVIDLPSCTYIGTSGIVDCDYVTTVSIPRCECIGANVFDSMGNLETLYVGISNTTVCQGGYFMLSGCGKLTSIYVPANLVDAYKSAQYWSSFASKIVPYNG